MRNGLLALVIMGLIAPVMNTQAAMSPHTRKVLEIRRQERKSQGSRDAMVDAIQQGKVGVATQFALESALKRATRQLKKEGQTALALDIESNWDNKYSMMVASVDFSQSVSLFNLGDFEVLWQWLDDAYNKIEAALGADVMASLQLTDIRDINFAMRVVFDPKDLRWDAAEYKLHFVPFMEIIGYWSAMGVCAVANFGLAEKLLCAPIAIGIRKGMGALGGALSDMIYDLATKN